MGLPSHISVSGSSKREDLSICPSTMVFRKLRMVVLKVLKHGGWNRSMMLRGRGIAEAKVRQWRVIRNKVDTDD
jgi:hypothetical protein